MSEKIKGMFGSETRADEVLAWLSEQGANSISLKNIAGTNDCLIYYVNTHKQVLAVSKKHIDLFDIVELSRWRAKKDEIYYYVTDTGESFPTFDRNTDYDKERYKMGNYFKTWDEVTQYSRKIREFFKERIE